MDTVSFSVGQNRGAAEDVRFLGSAGPERCGSTNNISDMNPSLPLLWRWLLDPMAGLTAAHHTRNRNVS